MSRVLSPPIPTRREQILRRRLQHLSLLELARYLLCTNRRAAWSELFERRLFTWGERERMLLLDLLNALHQSPRAFELVGKRASLVDDAYDLTVDHLLRPRTGRGNRRHGVDSRRYIQAFLRAAERRLGDQNLTSAECDALVAPVLQRFVARSFWRACLEAARACAGPRSRYPWCVNGGRLSVWLPKYLERRARGRWLIKHVPDPDPKRPGEKSRVQTIVDEYWGVPTHQSLDSAAVTERVGPRPTVPRCAEGERSALAELPRRIAHEKRACLRFQRDRIASLGSTRLWALVRDIFNAWRRGTYVQKRLAKEYGLDPATLNRFAGKNWRSSRRGEIPDLVVNLAFTIANDPALISAARAARVWPIVQDVLRRARCVRLGSSNRA